MQLNILDFFLILYNFLSQGHKSQCVDKLKGLYDKKIQKIQEKDHRCEKGFFATSAFADIAYAPFGLLILENEIQLNVSS